MRDEKLKRINWQCAFAALCDDVVGIIPYCWSVSTTHTGVKENPPLFECYKTIAKGITGK